MILATLVAFTAPRWAASFLPCFINTGKKTIPAPSPPAPKTALLSSFRHTLILRYSSSHLFSSIHNIPVPSFSIWVCYTDSLKKED